MVRAVMPLCSVLFLVLVSGQVAATPRGQLAVSRSGVFCEQPTNSIAAPPPKSEADVISLLNQWIAEKETISQMEIWWRERSKHPDALAIKPVSPPGKDTASQTETWRQHRTDLRPAMMATLRRPHRPQPHYASSATEFGCPPSVCSKASPTGPSTTSYNQSYEQAEQLYRQSEELYLRQLELQRAKQGR